MVTNDVVNYHLSEVHHAVLVEIDGDLGLSQCLRAETKMRLDTRVFDLCRERYSNLTELANAMRISVSQIYRVRQRKRPINEKFITGTLRAFPGYKLDDLFCVVPDGRRYGRR